MGVPKSTPRAFVLASSLLMMSLQPVQPSALCVLDGDNPPPDSCVLSGEHKGDVNDPTEINAQGSPFTGEDLCLIQAAIGFIEELEEACPDLPMPESDGPGMDGPAENSASEQLMDLLCNGKLCYENSDWLAGETNAGEVKAFAIVGDDYDYQATGGLTATTDDDVYSFKQNSPGIHVTELGMPRNPANPMGGTQIAIACDGGFENVDFGEFMDTVASLLHELHHYNEHQPNDYMLEGRKALEEEASNNTIEFMCALAECAAMALPGTFPVENMDVIKEACEAIKNEHEYKCSLALEAFLVGSMEPKPEPPDCDACETVMIDFEECMCPDMDDDLDDDVEIVIGDDESTTPVVPPADPEALEEHIPVQEYVRFPGYSGIISLNRPLRSLLLSSKAGQYSLTRNVVFGVQDPFDFQPLDFVQVSTSLVVLSGFSVDTGEGMIVEVSFNVLRGQVSKIAVLYRGSAFVRAESIAMVPGSNTEVYVLDSNAAKIHIFDIRDKDVDVVATGTAFPKLAGKTWIKAYLKTNSAGGSNIAISARARSEGPWPIDRSLGLQDPGYVWPASYSLLVDLNGDKIPDVERY